MDAFPPVFLLKNFTAFLKNKMWPETSVPVSFSACTLQKNVSHVIFYDWANSILCVPLVLKMLGNMLNVIICLRVCYIITFQINLSFLIKPFSYMIKRSEQKFRCHKNEKCVEHEIKRIFHHFKRAFSCQKLF